jgi:hypothetical protein|mmetsp:Transcript_66353/g.104940  ORF Transcript_66353/g.104940 Transcript_66353/m.104940 type:complete len:276 (-) Transcript_66353:73-900(-)
MAALLSTLALSFLTVDAAIVSNAANNAVQTSKLRTAHGASIHHFKHRLRVCNAYPFEDGLDIYRGRDKLTKIPLDYKMCGDFQTQLVAGDKLKFKVGADSAGTFTISDLPNNDAVLMLVIHRHDTLSNAVSFQSHVFANLLNAQIAIIDTYKGRARGITEISAEELSNGASKKRVEKLKYNSVVAVNPGEYKVSLVNAFDVNNTEAESDLVALNRESYVIIRVGVESEQGPQFAPDLIVYPMSDPALLRSFAFGGGSTVPIYLLIAMIIAAFSFQ